jgi:hypothetical protein
MYDLNAQENFPLQKLCIKVWYRRPKNASEACSSIETLEL